MGWWGRGGGPKLRGEANCRSLRARVHGVCISNISHLKVEGNSPILKPFCQGPCLREVPSEAWKGNICQPLLSQGAQARQQVIGAGTSILPSTSHGQCPWCMPKALMVVNTSRCLMWSVNLLNMLSAIVWSRRAACRHHQKPWQRSNPLVRVADTLVKRFGKAFG